MGAWSTAFYGDDLTCDVRDTYKHFLRMKCTPEQAIEKLVKDFQPEEAEDGYLFWLALADTQWRLGHLTEPLKERCLNILDPMLTQSGGQRPLLATRGRERRFWNRSGPA